MKTMRIILIMFVMIGITTHAQKFYIRGGLGFAVSTAASDNYNFNTPANSPTTITTNKKGIGTGLPLALAGGYMINEHFAFELGFNYFYGFTLQSTNTDPISSYDTKWRGQMLSIVPALVLSIPLDKLKPYARLGLKLGVLNSIVYWEQNVNIYESNQTTEVIQTQIKEYGGIAVGAQAAVGTEIVLSSRLSLFGEIQLDGISYSPKHGKYTEYDINGTDILGSLPVNMKDWNFVNETTFPATIPQDQPGEQVKKNFHFGNAGVVVGVKVSL